MFHRTSPSMLRRPATLLIGSGLVSATALTALPAYAAVLGPLDSPDSAYFAPANRDTAIQVVYTDPATLESSRVLPAGTYWVERASFTRNLPFYVEGLSEEHESSSSSWSRVVLEPNRSLGLGGAVGAPGSFNTVAIWKMPDGSPDPATLSEEEIYAAISDVDGVPAAPLDYALITAADIPDPMIAPVDQTANGDEAAVGDFLGIGADVPATRVGNLITVYGPDGQTLSFSFGRPADTMLVGDWDGDGQDTFGLRRGNLLFLDNYFDGGWAEHVYTFGRAGDEAIVGDWDGDGKDTVAVRRGNTFYFTNNFEGGNAPISFNYGRADDEVFVADWNQDGKDSFAVLRGDTLYVKNTLTGGVADGVYPIALG